MAYCRECGSKLNASDRFCPQCGADTAGGAAAAGAMGPGDGPGVREAEDSAELAGIGRRLAAQIVDSFVMLALFWAIGSKIAAQTGGQTESGFELQGGPALLAMMLTLVAALLYFTFLEAFWNGQTLGKKLLRIQVLETSGASCGFMAALMRNIVRLVDAFAFYLVGLVAVLVSKRKQRLGDMAAGTLVVKKRSDAGERPEENGKKGKVRFSMGVNNNFLDD